MRAWLWNAEAAPPFQAPKRLKRAHVNRRLRAAADDHVIKQYFSFLAEIMDVAILASKYVVQEITARKYPGTRDYELWMLWVACVATLLNEHDISVIRVTKKGRELSPHFVSFIAALQEHLLPEKLRNRTTRSSLLKGIEETRAILAGEPYAFNLVMLVARGMIGPPWGFKNLSPQ